MASVCTTCGEEVEFRYYAGAVRPFGCRCSSWGNGGRASKPTKQAARPQSFLSPQSYLNPNACCPICGANVYYYENERGSKIFFDDVGWPWPKHPCTDKIVQRGLVASIAKSTAVRTSLKSVKGEVVDVLQIVGNLRATCTALRFAVRRLNAPKASATAIFKVYPQAGKNKSFYAHALTEAPALLVSRSSLGNVSLRIRFSNAEKLKISSLLVHAEKWRLA